ncbi:MAG: hypothetical protein K2N89_10025 [Lachnospiraceae bacterium]|nr:hypothetical protein [Lachnospiraceae bacterium]
MKKLKLKNGQPYPLGASLKADGSINFSMVNNTHEECGIILYRNGVEQKERILFDKDHRVGNIFCAQIEGIDSTRYEYNFFVGDKVLVDQYAKRIVGNEKWRGGEFKRLFLRGSFCDDTFDWQGTTRLGIPYSESVMYCLNVRGFTRHGSSKVKNKGTFAGIIEKIPYLKDLGINAIELMPAYEFEECEWENAESIAMTHTIEYQVSHIDANIENSEPDKAKRLNCWGYKEAFYFAPKASYAADSDACAEFKRMVRELHKNGIEIIMQFYFPDNINQGYIVEILKHWVLEYHIDGFHLKGERVPVTLIATEPLFAQTKIMCRDFKLHEIYHDSESPQYKTLGYYRDEFMYDMRRYLKSDYGMLKNFQYHMRNYHSMCGIINYVTNYYGFTLADLVSYDVKHNEANGENNADGAEQNYSWNCGVEGPSRKKAINKMRHTQMKNILSFLFLSQGTPLLFAGDEFGNSQNGNNNCYCQDNETGWVDWRGLAKNADIHAYVKELIAFRRVHPITHLDDTMSMLDRFGYGYPDLSYHSDEAWNVRLDGNNRHIGIMYCGRGLDGESADYLYIASNMHWDSHRFALPSIANFEWAKALETTENMLVVDSEKKTGYIEVSPRSVTVLVGKKLPKPVAKKTQKTVAKKKTEKENDGR